MLFYINPQLECESAKWYKPTLRKNLVLKYKRLKNTALNKVLDTVKNRTPTLTRIKYIDRKILHYKVKYRAPKISLDEDERGE